MDSYQQGLGEISIIIPVYNEAGVIEHVIKAFYEKVVKRLPHARLIVAEDGSTDGTKDILKRINEEIGFTLISSDSRKGYTTAFKDALGVAKTDLVFFSDSDAQHDPEDIFKLLGEIGTNDIVSGYKSPRRDPVHRVLLAKGYNLLIHLLFGFKMRDIDSGFKLIKKEVIDKILPDVRDMKWCVMSEFILKAHLAGYRIKEVAVRHYPRKAGTTSLFTPARLPLIILGLMMSLLKIKFGYSGKRNK